MSPSFLRAQFIQFLLLFLIIVFLYINLHLNQSNCNCETNSARSDLCLPHFGEYLKANEEIRDRFLKKRLKDIWDGRDIKDIALWEHRNGWQFVWNHFPPVFTCPYLVERIGTAKDGGKWVCGLSIFEENKSIPCVIYSLGVAQESSFEVEMATRTNCSIYAYDYTVNGMTLPIGLSPEVKNRIHFFKLGLGSRQEAKEDDRFRTLGQLMRENGHEWIDFLKVDIEGSEFDLLTEMHHEFEMIPYGHLNIEIHLDTNATKDNVDEQRVEFQKLFHFWESLENKGLRAWWWEDNYTGCSLFDVPPVFIEYAFINVLDSERNRLIQF